VPACSKLFKSRKVGFGAYDADETKRHRLCCKYLCSDSMRNKKLEDNFKNVHSEHAKKPHENIQLL